MSQHNPDDKPWAATRHGLAAELGRIDGVLPGSVVRRQMRCGKPNCACKADPPTLHGPYIQWTRSVDGKTVTRYLSQDQLTRFQSWFDNARQLKDLIAKLEIASVHALEADRRPDSSTHAQEPRLVARSAHPRSDRQPLQAVNDPETATPRHHRGPTTMQHPRSAHSALAHARPFRRAAPVWESASPAPATVRNRPVFRLARRSSRKPATPTISSTSAALLLFPWVGFHDHLRDAPGWLSDTPCSV